MHVQCDQQTTSRIRGFKLWWWLYCADFEVLVPCLMQGDAGMGGTMLGPWWDLSEFTIYREFCLTRNHQLIIWW